MACLDTTFLIDLAGGGGKRRKSMATAKLRDLVSRGETLVTTQFNVAELYVGVNRADDHESEERAVAAVLAGLRILGFDDRAARLFGRLTAHLQSIGRPAGDMDVLIAATALAAGQSLVTRNPTHFANVPELVVEGH